MRFFFFSYVHDYFEASHTKHLHGTLSRRTSSDGWSLPEEGWLKLNSDGVLLADYRAVSCGGCWKTNSSA